MKNVDVANTRTFAVMGHTGSGKTTLIDALLFKLGVNDRLGSTDNGSSMADWTDSEKNRKITLQTKPFGALYKAKDGSASYMTFCDTPGYIDFYGQVIAASRVCESCLLVIDATSGIQLGTSKAWARANELGAPYAIVVTGLDRENADFAKVVEEVQGKWGAHCLPVVLPAPDAAVADVLAGSVPDSMADQAKDLSNRLTEIAAETDDSLIEKYLVGEALKPEEVASGLRKAVLSRKLVPIFACMPLKDKGITELLEGVLRLLPSPLERKMKDSEGNDIDPSPDAPFAGFVWHTVSDAYVGQLTFLRVCGGSLTTASDLVNSRTDEKERVAGLLVVNGKQQTNVDKATAGDIVAMTKLKNTKLNDVLCSSSGKITMKPLAFPNPVMSYAVKAKSRGDEDKIGMALNRVAEEDPTIKLMRNNETRELLLSGMGDVHLEVAVEQMKSRSNVEVLLSTPRIPYRETVTSTGQGHHKHKKQTGGHGQFAEVYLRVEPKQEGEEDWFINEIVGGAIPTNFIPAVQKGLVEGMTRGSIAGYPTTGIAVAVYDGSFHEVDSSEMAFKIASSRAFKEGMSAAKPVLLEPIMTVKIMVPEGFMGEITGDISHKRGRILGIEAEAGMQIISADVPLAEMFRYCAEIRSMTSGAGTFEMVLARYEIVPSNITEKVVASAEKEKQEVE
jgi:elongation factor G